MAVQTCSIREAPLIIYFIIKIEYAENDICDENITGKYCKLQNTGNILANTVVIYE